MNVYIYSHPSEKELFKANENISMCDLHVPKNNFTIMHTFHVFFEAGRRKISFFPNLYHD